MNATKAKIQAINDALRRSMPRIPKTKGLCVLTRGVASLDVEQTVQVLLAVQTYTEFNEDNDPHHEHDFGVVELRGVPKVFWKIDYFESEKMTIPEREDWGESEEDFINAYRLLTIMLASEY